jgi:hypothetical protein
MYLLVSVHGINEVPLRLYVSREAALADQLHWKPGSTDSSFGNPCRIRAHFLAEIGPTQG